MCTVRSLLIATDCTMSSRLSARELANLLKLDDVERISFVDLTNPKHKIHTDDSRALLDSIKQMEKEEKRKFLLAVCAELSKKGVSVTLWNGTLFSPDHSSASASASASAKPSAKPSTKPSPTPAGSSKGKGKKPVVDSAILIAKLKEGGVPEHLLLEAAMAVMKVIN